MCNSKTLKSRGPIGLHSPRFRRAVVITLDCVLHVDARFFHLKPFRLNVNFCFKFKFYYHRPGLAAVLYPICLNCAPGLCCNVSNPARCQQTTAKKNDFSTIFISKAQNSRTFIDNRCQWVTDEMARKRWTHVQIRGLQSSRFPLVGLRIAKNWLANRALILFFIGLYYTQYLIKTYVGNYYYNRSIWNFVYYITSF